MVGKAGEDFIKYIVPMVQGIGTFFCNREVVQKMDCVSRWETILHLVEAPKGQTKGQAS